MTRFAECLPLILASEGGYSNRPGDRGGPTNLGVTQATLSDWYGRPATISDVQALTPAAVAPIYEQNYWRASSCDRLPAGLDYIVFDLAVNSGPTRARKFLQQACAVTVDGAIGPQTMQAVGHLGALEIVNRMAAEREAFYRAQPEFGDNPGWLPRLARVTAQAREWAS